MVHADGKLEFKNDNYSFSDEKWNSYDAKSDMIKRQRNLYRVIHFTNLKTTDFLEIRFYQTDGMDVEINIFYSKDKDPGKCMIGKFNPETQSYIFEKILYFDKT